jgi:hypothetical protein
MEYEIYNVEDSLAHHGTKGMRWGIRRYQNKDGSLTPAGKKRYKSEMDALKEEERILSKRRTTKNKLDRLAAKKKAIEDQKKELDGDITKNGKSGDSDAATPTRRTAKDMSDEELVYAINRARLEDTYNQLRPQPVNEKNAMMKKILKDVVEPAAVNAGKNLVQNLTNQAVEKLTKGKVDPDSLEVLKKTFEKLDYKQKIDKLKNPDKYLSEEDRTKRQDRLFKAEDRAAKKEGYADAADKANKTREAEEAARKAKADEAARKAKADEAAREANNAKSEEYYNATYSTRGGESTRVNPNTRSGLLLTSGYDSSPVTDLATRSNVSRGESAVDYILEDSYGNTILRYN